MKRRTKKSGTTLIEAVTAAFMTVMLLTGAVASYLGLSKSALIGQSKLDTQGGAQKAVRRAASEVREAMSVTVDDNGKGITYTLPAENSDGTYQIPLTPDGKTHRLWVDDAHEFCTKSSDGNTNLVLCKGLVANDPVLNTPYRIFTGGTGINANTVTIEIVTQANTSSTSTQITRARETVYLRNIPVTHL